MKLTPKKLSVDLDQRAPVYTKQMQEEQQFPRGAEPTEILPHLQILPSQTLGGALGAPDELLTHRTVGWILIRRNTKGEQEEITSRSLRAPTS